MYKSIILYTYIFKVDSRGTVIYIDWFSDKLKEQQIAEVEFCLTRINFTRHDQYGDISLGILRDFPYCRISIRVFRDVAITTCVRQANKLI